MSESFDLTGRVAIITGASSGIGAATLARAFARAGASLVLSDYAAERPRYRHRWSPMSPDG